MQKSIQRRIAPMNARAFLRLLSKQIKQEAPSPKNLPLLDRLKSAWERLAVISALLYAIGYAARASHAWEQNLGALPGVQFDYFMSGLFICVPIVAFTVLLFFGKKFVAWLRAWAFANPGSALLVKNRILLPLLLGSIAIIILQGRFILQLPEHGALLQNIALFTFLAAFFLFSIVNIEEDIPADTKAASTGNWLTNFFRKVAASANKFVTVVLTGYFGSIVFAIYFAAAVYGAGLLGKWPQELGGVKAKCGVLDLAVEKLSPEMLTLMLPLPASAQPKSNTADVHPVVRSRQLLVYSTAGPWLIRVADPGENEAGKAPRIRSLRLPNESVLSVEWVMCPATP
jgi:hypothetical protein